MDFDLSRAQWRKSSYSGNTGNCIEVSSLDGVAGVRDSRDQDGPKLLVDQAQWRVFIEVVKSVGR